MGVRYWVEQKDGHDAHVYANDYALSPAEIVERLNEATKGWEQKSAELAALREDYKTKCGELAHAHAEYQRIEGALREEIARMYDLKQKFIAEDARLRSALVEIAKGEGRFSTDKYEHACYVIEDMKALAVAALDGKEDVCN